MTVMVKEGTIVKNNRGKLLVKVERCEACGSCAVKDSCVQTQESLIELFSADNLDVGDKVIITSNASDIQKFSLYVYVFPVIMMLLGAAVPNLFLTNSSIDINILTIISVILFLAISFLVVRNIEKKVSKKQIMKVRKI